MQLCTWFFGSIFSTQNVHGQMTALSNYLLSNYFPSNSTDCSQ